MLYLHRARKNQKRAREQQTERQKSEIETVREIEK